MEKVLTFLLVDDEPDILELGAEMLKMENQLVYTAQSGQSALSLLNEIDGEIDVIISDFNMPRMGGLELLQEVSRLQLSKVPKFYFSTGAIDFTEEEAKQHGATGVIYKPFDFDEVLERIDQDL